MPTTPYVTAAEFAAHPTYLDLDDLRSGVSDPAAQTAELTNLLLTASAWADGECNQPLAAHQVTTTTRGRIDQDGILRVHAFNHPVLAVSSLAYGPTPFALTTPDTSRQWALEGETNNVLLNTGHAFPAGQWLTVQWTYVAGWVSTVLTTDAPAEAGSLTVADPTGILPGTSYRLWEPGSEETITISPSYTPPAATTPPTATAVPLARPTTFAHTAGAGWSGMPADMRLAVVNYTVSLLMRPDTTAEDAYPDTSLAATTRQQDSRRDGSGLVAEAKRILNTYARRV
ncbi:hypothetical protein [Streptomyces cavernae]|uniref:hypothetical protein n=1 Tax=Streptomyces cavernae TaxID=2259034 RepID=UPI000FEBA5A8|nr:hypothetical protein [Streptomyces cavernae]